MDGTLCPWYLGFPGYAFCQPRLLPPAPNGKSTYSLCFQHIIFGMSCLEQEGMGRLGQRVPFRLSSSTLERDRAWGATLAVGQVCPKDWRLSAYRFLKRRAGSLHTGSRTEHLKGPWYHWSHLQQGQKPGDTSFSWGDPTTTFAMSGECLQLS